MVFRQPVKRVMDEEIPRGSAFIAIEVDGTTPWSVVAFGKKLRSIGIEVVSLRSKMVVNNVQKDLHSTDMSGVHKVLEILLAAVGAIDREVINAVIAPISLPREVGHRHQFQACDSMIGKGVNVFAYC